MRLGVMQPYFFPYLGHFSLIAHTAAWVVLDLTQYTPQSWMNRNRILHPQKGWKWITVPLANSGSSIRTWEARVRDVKASGAQLLAQLSHFRRKAPYCAAVEELVAEAFRLPPGDASLVHLDVRALEAVCRYIGLPFQPKIASELGLDLPAGLGAGDWSLEIACRLGADAYLNPISGRALFKPEQFAQRQVALEFLEPMSYRYRTGPWEPVEHLSIIDVLLWNEPSAVRDAARDLARIHGAGEAAVNPPRSAA